MLATLAVALIGMLTPVSINSVLPTPEPAVESEIARDPLIREHFWTLLRDAFYGHATLEEAAFIVRNADGALAIVRWPRAGTPHIAKWKGSFPEGTVAIAHTHPNRFPEPSRIDKRTARVRKVPVYVVTRLRITKTMGGPSVTIAKGDWRPLSVRAMR
jgi:hypothetical protein